MKKWGAKYWLKMATLINMDLNLKQVFYFTKYQPKISKNIAKTFMDMQ